jgi:hypothetical protein
VESVDLLQVPMGSQGGSGPGVGLFPVLCTALCAPPRPGGPMRTVVQVGCCIGSVSRVLPCLRQEVGVPLLSHWCAPPVPGLSVVLSHAGGCVLKQTVC